MNNKVKKIIQQMEYCSGIFDYIIEYDEIQYLLSYIYELEIKINKLDKRKTRKEEK